MVSGSSRRQAKVATLPPNADLVKASAATARSGRSRPETVGKAGTKIRPTVHSEPPSPSPPSSELASNSPPSSRRCRFTWRHQRLRHIRGCIRFARITPSSKFASDSPTSPASSNAPSSTPASRWLPSTRAASSTSTAPASPVPDDRRLEPGLCHDEACQKRLPGKNRLRRRVDR